MMPAVQQSTKCSARRSAPCALMGHAAAEHSRRTVGNRREGARGCSCMNKARTRPWTAHRMQHARGASRCITSDGGSAQRCPNSTDWSQHWCCQHDWHEATRSSELGHGGLTMTWVTLLPTTRTLCVSWASAKRPPEGGMGGMPGRTKGEPVCRPEACSTHTRPSIRTCRSLFCSESFGDVSKHTYWPARNKGLRVADMQLPCGDIPSSWQDGWQSGVNISCLSRHPSAMARNVRQ
jgi:hypothetical protein